MAACQPACGDRATRSFDDALLGALDPSIARGTITLRQWYDNVTLPRYPVGPCPLQGRPAEGGHVGPMIEVKLYDRRVTEESVPKMIEALTNALAETSGASPDHIQVVIQGVDPEALGHRRQAAVVNETRAREDRHGS